MAKNRNHKNKQSGAPAQPAAPVKTAKPETKFITGMIKPNDKGNTFMVGVPTLPSFITDNIEETLSYLEENYGKDSALDLRSAVGTSLSLSWTAKDGGDPGPEAEEFAAAMEALFHVEETGETTKEMVADLAKGVAFALQVERILNDDYKKSIQAKTDALKAQGKSPNLNTWIEAIEGFNFAVFEEDLEELEQTTAALEQPAPVTGDAPAPAVPATTAPAVTSSALSQTVNVQKTIGTLAEISASAAKINESVGLLLHQLHESLETATETAGK